LADYFTATTELYILDVICNYKPQWIANENAIADILSFIQEIATSQNQKKEQK